MRQPLVIANWKMHGTVSSVADLLEAVKQGVAPFAGRQVAVAVCPAYVHLAQVRQQLHDSAIAFGAQDVSAHAAGAHTGEVAAEMLLEAGCRYVLVGHSERRQFNGESDEQVAQKFWRAVACGLQPVLCVGETLAERKAGNTLAVVKRQLQAVMDTAPAGASIDCVAYEPVWAIGTGETATAEQAQQVHMFIRRQLGSQGSAAQLLYGGSVKADNAGQLFAEPDIDGGLIGGASLEAESFIAICRAAF